MVLFLDKYDLISSMVDARSENEIVYESESLQTFQSIFQMLEFKPRF
jgi:hypothetical protein